MDLDEFYGGDGAKNLNGENRQMAEIGWSTLSKTPSSYNFGFLHVGKFSQSIQNFG